ncbi:MAG: tetratricopeptide repeat protein, partial [Duncaniella sp.]|nr:tetratricopeptide repeat protein [Duncaniella sp.]
IPHNTPSQAPDTAYDSSLSESLAKIYIRQKRYDKAFEIIHTLSLNNPKKSAYFADQLRFLRKLMLNRESANKSK